MSDPKDDQEPLRRHTAAYGDELREAAVARARELHEAAVTHATSVMDALRGKRARTPPPSPAPQPLATSHPVEAPAAAPTQLDGTPPAAPEVPTETASS